MARLSLKNQYMLGGMAIGALVGVVVALVIGLLFPEALSGIAQNMGFLGVDLTALAIFSSLVFGFAGLKVGEYKIGVLQAQQAAAQRVAEEKNVVFLETLGLTFKPTQNETQHRDPALPVEQSALEVKVHDELESLKVKFGEQNLLSQFNNIMVDLRARLLSKDLDRNVFAGVVKNLNQGFNVVNSADMKPGLAHRDEGYGGAGSDKHDSDSDESPDEMTTTM